MEIEDLKANEKGTTGFGSISDFKGQTTTINTDVFISLLEFAKAMKKNGFKEICVGVEKDGPLAIFLDKSKTFALLTAPYLTITE